MPEVGVHYVGIELLLSRGDEMARGHVVAHSHEVSGNVISRAHTNPILDTKMYQVEFARSVVTKLTINIITESM